MNAHLLPFPTDADYDRDVAYFEAKISACYDAMDREAADQATAHSRAYLAKLKETRDIAFPRPTRYDRLDPV